LVFQASVRLEDGAKGLFLHLGRGLLEFADLSHHFEEASFVVELDLGGGLKESAAPASGQLGAFVVLHLALVLQVTLVADQHQGHFVCVLRAKDLVVQNTHFVKSGPKKRNMGKWKEGNENLVSTCIFLHGSRIDIKRSDLHDAVPHFQHVERRPVRGREELEQEAATHVQVATQRIEMLRVHTCHRGVDEHHLGRTLKEHLFFNVSCCLPF